MSDVPKIVHDRLRANPLSGPHPDPDVLTAFAEQALSTAERGNVVQHLARCGECREVVALSLPAVEAFAQPAPSGERIGRVEASSGRAGGWSPTWLAWPNLRWAALAAGVVVVASVVMLRPGKEYKPAVAVLDKQGAPAAATTDTAAKPAAPSGGESDELRSRAFVMESSAPKSVKPGSLARGARPALRKDQESAPARTQPKSVPPVSGVYADNKYAVAPEAGQRDLKASPAPATEARAGSGVSEQVEVSTEQAVVSTEAANLAPPASQQNKLMVRSEAPAPISKAKAAAKEETAMKQQAGANDTQSKADYSFSVSGGALTRQKLLTKDAAAQWSLTQGALRRSLDGGASWQTALQLEHPLLSFGARGSDVWAGGQAGALFHSPDNGTTWTQVQPSTKAGSLSADIVAIAIRSPVEIVVTTSDKESWTTADGGKTWEKK